MSTTSSEGPFGAPGYGSSPALGGGSTSPISTNPGGASSGSSGSGGSSSDGSGSGDYSANGSGYYGANGATYSSSSTSTSTGSSTGSTSGAPDQTGTELSRGALTTRTAPTQRVSPGAAHTGQTGPMGQAGHTGQGARHASSTATRKHRGPRRVRLAVARVDPWSVMKMSFLLSVALGIAGVVLTAVLWMILSTMNVFTDVEGVLQSLQTTTSDPFSIKDYVGFGRVVSLSIVIGVIDVILMTAIATVMAFLYNICSALVGGVQLTLTDD